MPLGDIQNTIAVRMSLGDIESRHLNIVGLVKNEDGAAPDHFLHARARARVHQVVVLWRAACQGRQNRGPLDGNYMAY